MWLMETSAITNLPAQRPSVPQRRAQSTPFMRWIQAELAPAPSVGSDLTAPDIGVADSSGLDAPGLPTLLGRTVWLRSAQHPDARRPAVEPRPLPINTVLGLLVPGDVNPVALF